MPRSKAEAAKKLKKVQNVRPDYSKLKKKELDELAEEIGVDGTKKEMAEKLQAVSDGPTDTPKSAEILQDQLQSGKRATKKAVKDFLEDADDILNFFKLTQKINKETDKKMKAEVVGTDQDDKNIEIITDYRRKHGWANYHSQKEIPIHEASCDGCLFRRRRLHLSGAQRSQSGLHVDLLPAQDGRRRLFETDLLRCARDSETA